MTMKLFKVLYTLHKSNMNFAPDIAKFTDQKLS